MNILILIVGGNPIANYALIEYTKNQGDDIIPKTDKVLLVASEQTLPVAKNIEDLQKDVEFDVVNLGTNESNLAYIKEQVGKSLLNMKDNISSIHLNYTGGRKPMSIGTYLAVVDFKCECRKIYSDISPNNNNLTLDDGSTYPENEDLSSRLNIQPEEFYLLHDKQPPVSKDENSEFYDERFVEFLINQNIENMDKFYIDLWDKKVEELKHLDWKSSIEDFNNKTLSNKQLEKMREFVRGGFLEEYIFSELKKIEKEVGITKLIWNAIGKTKAKKNEDGKEEYREFEIDVLAICGYKSYLFTCSSDRKIKLLKLKAFEGSVRSGQIGGNESKTVLVSLADEDTKRKVIADMEDLEKQKNFYVFGANDVKFDTVSSKLKKIFDDG